MTAQVALKLFHGRCDPALDMDVWGGDGPIFIATYVHTTYGTAIKLGIPNPAGDGDLKIVDNLVYYDGVYYGDWSVFPATLLERDRKLAGRVVPFEAKKARLS